jgi:hypothetical protein
MHKFVPYLQNELEHDLEGEVFGWVSVFEPAFDEADLIAFGQPLTELVLVILQMSWWI